MICRYCVDAPEDASIVEDHTHHIRSVLLTATSMTTAAQELAHGQEYGGMRFSDDILAAIHFHDTPDVLGWASFIAVPNFAPKEYRGTFYNRRIGIFGPAELWVKPWAERGRIICWDTTPLDIAFPAHACLACGDTLPDGARFCIACGHVIASIGKTERIAVTGVTRRLEG